MKPVYLLAAASLAVFVSACDQIRLPGAGEPTLEKAPEPAETAPAAADVPVAQDVMAQPAETAATGTETGGETPTVDRDDTTTPIEELSAETAALAPPPANALAMLNASRCALPEDAAQTLTVAAVAGATTLEEPAFGVEAVNALAATLTAFPGIVKLEPRRADPGGTITSGHCSAVRIRDTWFLTAAHCVDQPYDEIRMIGDTENLRSPTAHVTTASTAICHGGYHGTDSGYSNDIALLHLTPEQAAPLTGVPVARIATTGFPLAPANYPAGDMAGWGLTRFGGQLSNDLLSTRLKITAVGPAAISVASQGGAGPCIGDSGGPLYVTEMDGTRTAVGILSVVEQNRATGQFCAGDYNGRYTNLQGYTGWIDSVIALCEAEPGACH